MVSRRIATIAALVLFTLSFRTRAAQAEGLPSDAAASLSHSPRQIQLAAGKSHRILITAVGSDGFEQDVTTRSAFVSDDPDVAAVDARGMVRGIAPGDATITATCDGKTTAAAVTVTAA